MKSKLLPLLLASGFVCTNAIAQKPKMDSLMHPKIEATPVHKFYFSQSMDAAIFSTANVEKTGQSSKLSTLRFSYVLNIGVNANYDFNEHFGVMAGLNIKNIGFIEKISDSTIKRRVYTLGIPVGLKIGNLPKRNYFFLGGGFDVPFNYKEKGFIKRGSKTKMNEWFSDRTPAFMPYVFAGFSVHPGITFKFQYYPSNFLNQDYVASGGVKPYAAYEKVNLMLLSIGADLHYGKPGHKKADSNEDDNMTMLYHKN